MPAPRSKAPDKNRRLPVGNEIFLDHIAHFVPDAKAASNALARAGFLPTPISIQHNRDPDGERRPTGTGNLTAMLEHGYIEILFKTADTPLAREFEQALSRHAGVHLAAFAAADAREQSQRLKTSGFRVRPIVELKRPIGTEAGEAEAAFSVARVEPGEMREGRIQFLTHHSEDAVWQKRYLSHPNGARALLGLVIVVADVSEAAGRYGRFLAADPLPTALGQILVLDRGCVHLMDQAAFQQLMPGPLPPPPFLGLYAIRVDSLDRIAAHLAEYQIIAERRGSTLLAQFPAALGRGAWLFVEREFDLPWRAI